MCFGFGSGPLANISKESDTRFRVNRWIQSKFWNYFLRLERRKRDRVEKFSALLSDWVFSRMFCVEPSLWAMAHQPSWIFRRG